MYLFLYFLLKGFKCSHENMPVDGSSKYCPDCGKEIEISWYVLRCGHCSARRNAKTLFDSFEPVEKYCSKCGAKGHYLEKKEKLEFFDMNYAFMRKEQVYRKAHCVKNVQVWVDGEKDWGRQTEIKLIPSLAGY